MFIIHFNKCPHPVKALIPIFETLSQDLLVFSVFTLLHPEFEDPVYAKNPIHTQQ